MGFTLADKNSAVKIVLYKDEYKGVKRVADWLCDDIKIVTGREPELITDATELPESGNILIAGTLGVSKLAEDTARTLGIDISGIQGKREVFGIFVKDNTVLILGSEKRGTIYGLLHISELIGITPMKYFGDLVPVHYDTIVFEEGAGEKKEGTLKIDPSCISKEPSVKYRGFFINDEWPAFGNWCNRHFGGFTAECYEKVFEYLLRLKGNYMWPAMWSSIFSMDGPDLKSAELADELGVVMGTSHHEPCCRAGEEFQKLKKQYPEYGTDWSFLTNREGVTKFWEDGLKRSGKFENVITVGMRGEADSKLFADATLEDNINVLKNVINCQKELISKYTDGKQPLMLAVYKEVEEYYKGSADTPGLKDWDGLEGITLMLCDDNFGNLRLMMDDNKRDHNGGYGMYYHFDYHGGPVSYEWINSSYLPKIWEQMTTAYDFGIRDIWIVNVGDLKNQELPLSYFMDLAYDYEKYGSEAKDNYIGYLDEWVNKQFAGLDKETIDEIKEVTEGYTRINNIVKPEVLGENTYSLEHFNEAIKVLKIVNKLEKKALELDNSIKGAYHDTYFSLVGFQALASFNLVKMQIYAGMNKKYATQGRVTANKYAKYVKECIKRDRELTEIYHTFAEGKWYGMGLSKHIGFRAWNEEGCRLPVMVYVETESKNDLVVADDDSDKFSGGGAWTSRPLRLSGFDYRGKGSMCIATAGSEPVTYTLECTDPDIVFTSGKDKNFVLSGIADSENNAHISVQLKENGKTGKHEFAVKTNAGRVKVFFEVKETANIISVPAESYIELKKGKDGEFRELKDFGRLLPGEEHSALKAFPQDRSFKDAPAAVYKVNVPADGRYGMIVYTAPSNPSSADNRIPFGLTVNAGEKQIINTIPEGYVGGENYCGDWCRAVLENVRRTKVDVTLKKGENIIEFEATEPGFVLEKFELVPDGMDLPYSRLGCI